MLQGKGCQEKEEKHSALIHEVPRNICVVLISNSCLQGSLWIIFLFNPPSPGGKGGDELECTV